MRLAPITWSSPKPHLCLIWKVVDTSKIGRGSSVGPIEGRSIDYFPKLPLHSDVTPKQADVIALVWVWAVQTLAPTAAPPWRSTRRVRCRRGRARSAAARPPCAAHVLRARSCAHKTSGVRGVRQVECEGRRMLAEAGRRARDGGGVGPSLGECACARWRGEWGGVRGA
jgi:hypothetical protein